jgi:NOL1/NOP2/fmu family ribosome biogenesis protein
MKRVPFAEVDGAPYRAWWRRRFDPQADPFAGLRFYQRGRATIWVGSADIAGLESTRMDAVGLHLLRIGRRVWKPTSTAIVAFAADARRNVLEMSREEVTAFLAGDEIELPPDDGRRDGLTRGFIAARYAGVGLGCAEWHERGVLRSLIPKRQRVRGFDF